MTSTTLDIYELLVEAGIDQAKAKPLAKEILSREDTRLMLATKDDISKIEDRLRGIIMWVAGLMIGQIAIMTGVMSLMFNLYA